MNALAHCMLEPVEFSRVVQYSYSTVFNIENNQKCFLSSKSAC